MLINDKREIKEYIESQVEKEVKKLAFSLKVIPLNDVKEILEYYKNFTSIELLKKAIAKDIATLEK